jgi:hypothetical protein
VFGLHARRSVCACIARGGELSVSDLTQYTCVTHTHVTRTSRTRHTSQALAPPVRLSLAGRGWHEDAGVTFIGLLCDV